MDIVTSLAKLLDTTFEFLDNDSNKNSKEDVIEIKKELLKVHSGIVLKILDLEKSRNLLQADILNNEIKGTSWLQRNWRPLTMLTFLILITLDCLGVLKHPIDPQMWTLLQLGMGGYVVGRSAEKVIPDVIKSLNKNK